MAPIPKGKGKGKGKGEKAANLSCWKRPPRDQQLVFPSKAVAVEESVPCDGETVAAGKAVAVAEVIKYWDDVEDFWIKKDDVLKKDVYEITEELEPFPSGWTKNAGVKAVEDADLIRIRDANRKMDTLMDPSVGPGDYRGDYEGVYFPVEVTIFTHASKTRPNDKSYDVMTYVCGLFMCIERRRGLAYGITDILREIRYWTMHLFAFGNKPGMGMSWDDEELLLPRKEEEEVEDEEGMLKREANVLFFFPCRFPKKAKKDEAYLEVILQTVRNRLAQEKRYSNDRDDCLPPTPADPLLMDVLQGKKKAYIVTHNINEENEPDKWTPLVKKLPEDEDA